MVASYTKLRKLQRALIELEEAPNHNPEKLAELHASLDNMTPFAQLILVFGYPRPDHSCTLTLQRATSAAEED